MLSGGLSPNTAAMFNTSMGQSPGGTRYGNIDMNMGDSSTSTGLTPNFQMDPTNPFTSMNSAASPFSVFGNSGAGVGMMDAPQNLDWVSIQAVSNHKAWLTTLQEAWDSYIQNGNTIDPAFQFYQTTMDQSQLNPDGQTDPTFGNSVFMGANTPGR